MALEYQRYGRNKETLINKTYIESGEYRRKFDNATDNPKVNKTLYECAKKALKHRSGTVLEDMYWIDGDTGEILFFVINSAKEREINYTVKLNNIVKNYDNIITIHTHPGSMPPSVEDLNSCHIHGYSCGYIACHNGKLFKYSSKQHVPAKLYVLYVGNYLDDGYDEFEAQSKALDKIKKSYVIEWEEVIYNG